MTIEAKYNTALTIEFPIIKRGAVDFAVTGDWTPATGDTKVSKDGGNVANTTNNPAAVGGTGSALWTLTLTSTEMTAARVVVQIVDSATKAVEDQSIVILTYGHASAHFVEDRSVAKPANSALLSIDGNGRVDVIKVAGSSQTAADIGAIVSSGTYGLAAVKALIDTLTGYVDTEVAAIKAKTDNLPSDPADESLIIAATDAIMTRLGVPSVSVSADIAGIPAAVGAGAPASETYPADGVIPTRDQAILMLISMLLNHDFSGTTHTFRKLDKTTSWGTALIDSTSNPTSHSRAT